MDSTTLLVTAAISPFPVVQAVLFSDEPTEADRLWWASCNTGGFCPDGFDPTDLRIWTRSALEHRLDEVSAREWDRMARERFGA